MTRYFSCQNGNKKKKIVIFAKKRNMKNILCFEGEWLFNDDKKKNRLSLNTEPVLRMLQEERGCHEVGHRRCCPVERTDNKQQTGQHKERGGEHVQRNL